MRTIPIIIVLLIGQIELLGRALDLLGPCHRRLYLLSELDEQFIKNHSSSLRLVSFSWFALIWVCFALIIIIWKHRLCHRWVTVGLMTLWLIVAWHHVFFWKPYIAISGQRNRVLGKYNATEHINRGSTLLNPARLATATLLSLERKCYGETPKSGHDISALPHLKERQKYTFNLSGFGVTPP